MVKNSWYKLDVLGREYIDDVITVYGSNYKSVIGEDKWRKEFEERNDLRKGIANDVVSSVQPYLRGLALKLLFDSVKFKGRKISLRCVGHLYVEDMVQEASIYLIEHFASYNPKFTISTWVKLRAVMAMCRYGANDLLVYVPLHLRTKVVQMLKMRKTEEEIRELFMTSKEKEKFTEGLGLERLNLVLLSLRNDYLSLEEILDEESSEKFLIDEGIEETERLRILFKDILGHEELSEDEKVVIIGRYFEEPIIGYSEFKELIGPKSREGARQVELRALEKLKDLNK